MLLDTVAHFIEEEALIEAGARVLVGVSGGVDSVVLLHVLIRLNIEVSVAHVNYALRGEASDEDAAFVRVLCKHLNVPLHTTTFETKAYADTHGQSVQEAARDLRYDFFQRIAHTEGTRFVAVAHHFDDQAETFMLNLLRGTGIEGLAGMRPKRPLSEGREVFLLRPLLPVRRAEIEAYALAEGLSWREDASNRSLSYRRNVLRTVVFPTIENHMGSAAIENMVRTASHVRAYVDDAFQTQLSSHFDAASRVYPAGGGLDLVYLQELPVIWQGRLILEGLKRWLPEAPRRSEAVRQIRALLDAQPGRKVVFRTGILWRERDALVFSATSLAHRPAMNVCTMSPGDILHMAQGDLSLTVSNERPPSLDLGVSPRAVVVDADTLSFPLVVRPWQPGDRFQPFGMQGTKKVSDLLTDQKVPSHQRADTLVVVSGMAIVWVVGYRLAEPVRVRPETGRFAKITFIPAG